MSSTPSTSIASLALEPDAQNPHLYDMELCELLHSLEAPNLPEAVKKAVRKAVRARARKFGMKHDYEVSGNLPVAHNETLILPFTKSIRQYRMNFHDHDPQVHLQPNFVPELSEVRCPLQYRSLQVLISAHTIAKRTP